MKIPVALKNLGSGLLISVVVLFLLLASILVSVVLRDLGIVGGKKVIFPSSYSTVSTPTLPAGVIKLTVAHVVNPRLAKLSEQQVALFLGSLRANTKAQLGRDIEFGPVETFTIEEYFRPIMPAKIAGKLKLAYDFKSGNGDRAQLEKAYGAAIAGQSVPAVDWASYAAREIGLTRIDTDPKEWQKRLTEVHLARLGQLLSIKAADGKPVLESTPYNEWTFWSALGERDKAHDFIITNQLVASAEYSGVDIHSALRGGITVGTTDYSTNAQFGMQTWWSTFPFTSNDPQILQMRGGEQYDQDEAPRVAGAAAVHELGHLFYMYGHPFGDSSCLMSPTPMLRFKEYLSKLDPEKCASARHASMQPGAGAAKRPVYEMTRSCITCKYFQKKD